MVGKKHLVMAKQSYGILDGYRGTVGTVIGYRWRGKWCLRAKPRFVRNPRTEAQQAHRMLFRDMVRLAGRMLDATRWGLGRASMEEGMTECNLFVRLNKDCFSAEGVDYERLAVSHGPVAPVGFTAAGVDGHGVLHVEWEKNPLGMRCKADDDVFVYAWCPSLEQGCLAAPAKRSRKRMDVALPDEFLGQEVHCYGFTRDMDRQTSETAYIPDMLPGQPGDTLLGQPGDTLPGQPDTPLGRPLPADCSPALVAGHEVRRAPAARSATGGLFIPG